MTRLSTLKKLEELYFDPSNPGSFASIDNFKSNNKNKIRIPKKKLQAWLESQETYSLHKQKRKHFPTNQFISAGINDTLQADLIDLSKLAWHNSNFKWILVVIDIFTKKAWAVALKNKTNQEIIRGFMEIFATFKTIPKRLQTDQGLEFLGKETREYLEKLNIHLYFIYSDKKAAVVERFNRTLKSHMHKYFTQFKTKNFIEILDKLIDGYNNTIHRSIGMTPNQVTEKNESEVFFNLYGFRKHLNDNHQDKINLNVKIKFRIGDLVRIAKYKNIFEKGYTSNWSDDLFTIKQVILNPIVVYKLKNKAGEHINGVFYEQELEKVFEVDSINKIEKILRTRISKIDGEKEYLVKWSGLSSDYNCWTSTIE